MFQLSPLIVWNYMGEKWHENARLPRNVQGSFTCRKSTTWGRRLYFPSEGRRAEDFFALKNPAASVGFVPGNLGTKGQHATSRPPKPLEHNTCLFWFELCLYMCATRFGLYLSSPQEYQYKTLIKEDIIKVKEPLVYSHYFLIKLKQYKI